MEERNYNLEIEQLHNLKINREKICEMIAEINAKERIRKIGIYNPEKETVLQSEFFGDFESLYSTFKTLALADLNKQIAKIDEEIKKRLC